ncbi:putative nuclease HARBI1 [Heptranchias perlo]|uniref:putative nuclease HARBI1 n=1 Tax=Heptranchias perlo TaxID=212740 RepID=UPI003559944D
MTEICQSLQPQLQPQSRARIVLPLAVKVTVALNFYGSGSYQAAAGDITNISQFVVCCSMREFTEVLYTMRDRFISLARDKQEEGAQGVAQIAGFPMVQGAIDCMRIALHAPHLNSDIFINRKGSHSLKLVCNHRQRIMQVNARYPDSSHNYFILWQSSLPPVFQPARNACISALQAYNKSHAAIRNIIENTIGVLKQCFHCLVRSGGGLQYSAERVSRFITVCCMLHSLVIMREQPLPPPIRREPEGHEQEEGVDEVMEEEVQQDVEEEEGRLQHRLALSARALHDQIINERYQ